MAANIRLSGPNPGDPREESDIRFNYANLQQIICASTKLGGPQPMHYSGDGGATWSQSSLATFAPDVRQGDPTIDWTSDGTAWTVTIGISATLQLALRTFKSTNAGATWAFDSTVPGGQTATDKQSLWVDHSATSPHHDTMYVMWDNTGPGFVSVRPSGGAWGAPLPLSGAETTGTAIGSDIKTNTFGDVFAFWHDTGSRNVFVRKSTDGAATFALAVAAANTFGGFQIGVPAQDGRRVLIYPSGGAYRTATKNLVYATWMDLAGGAGCNASFDEPGNNTASACKTRVYFTRSTDGGTTWDVPRKINDQASKNDQIFQRLAVDETTGELVVVYYDTVNDPGRTKTDLWMQRSTDDGVTWSAAVQITTADTDETTAGAVGLFQYGDYIGLTGHAGQFFACWTDRRSGGTEEIWGQAISSGPPIGTYAFLSSKLDAQVMDIFGGDPAPLAHVVAFPKKTTGTDNQQWRLVPSAVPGYYFVQSLLNGLVLDILGGSPAPFTPIIMWPQKSTGEDNQLWRLVPDGGGPYYFFESKLNGFVIDIRGADTDPATHLIAWPRKPNGFENQLWKFT